MSVRLVITERVAKHRLFKGETRHAPVTICQVYWEGNLEWPLEEAHRSGLGNWCVRNIGTFWNEWATSDEGEFMFSRSVHAMQFAMRWRGSTIPEVLKENREPSVGCLW